MIRIPLQISAVIILIVLFNSPPARGGESGKLLFSGDENYPPYEFMDSGVPKGFNVELMRAVAKTMGLNVEFRLAPWKRARRELEQGITDGVVGMYYSEERGRLVDFSIPHTLITPGLLVRSDSSIHSMGDLAGMNVIVQDSDVLHDMLIRAGITSRIVRVPNSIQAIKLLASGKYDCFLMTSRLQSEYYIKKQGLTALRWVPTDLPQLRYCFAVRKGSRELLYKLDEGLYILKVNGAYQRIYEKWFGVYEKRDQKRTISYFIAALALVITLLLASFLWSRSLQRQVRKRTAELVANGNELRKAHGELEQRVAERTADLAALNDNLCREIVERTRIEEGLCRSNQRLEMLAEMASQLLRSESPQKAVLSLCRRVLDFLECDVFFNYLIDDQRQQLFLNACSGIRDEDRERMRWLDFGVGLCGCSARDGVRLVVNDIQNTDDQYTALIRPFGVLAYACHPLISHGRILGTLSFCSRTKNGFTDDDLSLMKTVADHVAIAMERKKSGEQLKQRQEQLEELNRSLDRRVREEVTLNRQKDLMLIRQNRQAALGEMLEQIAHQWKQPLNSISLIIQDLEESWYNDELDRESLEETVDKTMALVEHMSQTINVFRDFYRPEKEKTTFRIRESIDSALSFIAPSLKLLSIRIDLEVDPALSGFGYPREYAQVLLNILANARDAFKARNIREPRMKIRACGENNIVWVIISDNAGGIPESIIDRVFDLYFTTNESSGGSGVGLYMSKNIIERSMGGSLDVRNSGEGTQFRIQIGMA